MKQPIKLAIVGASSTGKTTLWNNLKNQYTKNTAVAFVHESAREYFMQENVTINFTRENQEKILALGLANEKHVLLQYPRIMVTDTTPIETVFYTQANGDYEGAKFLLEKIRPWIKTYTKFLLLNPNDVKFENDEVRKETKETRDNIHKLLVEFYQKEYLPFTLISGTIPERQKRIHDIIQAYLMQ